MKSIDFYGVFLSVEIKFSLFAWVNAFNSRIADVLLIQPKMRDIVITRNFNSHAAAALMDC